MEKLFCEQISAGITLNITYITLLPMAIVTQEHYRIPNIDFLIYRFIFLSTLAVTDARKHPLRPLEEETLRRTRVKTHHWTVRLSITHFYNCILYSNCANCAKNNLSMSII